MRKIIAAFVVLFFISNAEAKKVKFAVDMTGQTVSVNGIHLSGDMQDEAGYSADWVSNSIKMEKEDASNIYSVILDIPAFRKYEYKFVNGDLFYEVEFVPEESRVGYDFNDNRWIYVDSLANDTFVIGNIMFGGNAPLGQLLVHFKVNLKNEANINSNGVHLASSLNDWNYGNIRLYSFVGKVYEYKAFVDSNSSFTYKFVNGNLLAESETVPSSCSSNGNRTQTVSTDLVLDSICFSSCDACAPSAGNNDFFAQDLSIKTYPNPANNTLQIESDLGKPVQYVSLYDLSGKMVLSVENTALANPLNLDIDNLNSGIYTLRVQTDSAFFHSKLTIQK